MKKYLFIAVLMVSSGVMFGQKFKVTTAYNAFEGYKRDKDPADLQKAKLNIDEASVHADTKDDAKTWYYRGNIYLALYKSELAAKVASITDVADANKKQSMAYVATPVTNLTEASNAYLKAKTLDKVGVYDGISTGLSDCYVYTQNVGISNYNQEKYVEAYPMFELAIAISGTSGTTDTLNINNAAVSAMNGKLYDKAIGHFKKLTEIGYGKGNTWLLLAQCQQDKGDTVAYKATIADGLKKFPNDADLLTEDVNIKLSEGKSKEAVAQLEALTAQRKDDPELFFVVGNVYDRMANPNDKDGKPGPKPANYEELHGKAAENYKKAVELKPDYFDALYNLGILYYNQSIEYYNRSNSTIADAAKYGTLWEPPLKVAIEYLEKARVVDPKDLNTLLALKICYGNLGDTDNYNKMKDEIKKVQGQ
ncbi:MAG TPA: tetratricopeptide repeat protein [Bacteroidia bacterium]|nr:tetratricopeptide repeat protein [Bacteroidia bacterium]